MCDCINVDLGSWDNAEKIKIPEIGHAMSQYIKNRQRVGLSKKRIIIVDKCIVEEIKDLWSYGIKTSGCCCGHNKQNGYIGVIDKTDEIKMKKLGYIVALNKLRPNDEDSFYPMSINRIDDIG